MRNLILLFTVLASLITPLAQAESTIEITSPIDNSKLSLNTLTLEYKAFLEGEDDHVIIFIDDMKMQSMRKTRTEYEIEKMPLGKHEVCIKVALKDHSLTGRQQCVHITIEATPQVGYGNFSN